MILTDTTFDFNQILLNQSIKVFFSVSSCELIMLTSL